MSTDQSRASAGSAASSLHLVFDLMEVSYGQHDGQTEEGGLSRAADFVSFEGV